MRAKEFISIFLMSAHALFNLFTQIIRAFRAPLTQIFATISITFNAPFYMGVNANNRRHGVLIYHGNKKNVGGRHPPRRNTYSSYAR